MALSDKISKLQQIKNDIKAALKAKGLVTDATAFSAYPTAMAKLTKEEPKVNLTIKFDNQLYTSTTTGSRGYYASGSSTKQKGYLKVNGVDYYSQVLGEKVTYDTKQYDVSITVQVPANSTIKIEAYMIMGTSKTNPLYRRFYSDKLYTSNPDTKTISTTTYNTSVTFTAKYDDDAYMTY